MSEEIPVDDLKQLIHEYHGDRVARMLDSVSEDEGLTSYYSGEAAAARLLLTFVEDYERRGEFPPSEYPEQQEAYADVSRLLIYLRRMHTETEQDLEPRHGFQ